MLTLCLCPWGCGKELTTREKAEGGDADAQFNLGVMYEGGYGVKKDLVLAYAWCNIAAADGHESAERAKQNIGKKLTPEQIAKAEALAKEMIAKNPKLIKKP